MKRNLVLSAFVLTTAGSLFLGSNLVSAQEEADPHQSLIKKLATRLNVSEQEVQKVFEEERVVYIQKKRQKMQERLDELVRQGKITPQQKEAIIAKHEELRANRKALMESMQTMTEQERTATHQKHKKEMEAWAKENGIDPEALPFVIKFKHKRVN